MLKSLKTTVAAGLATLALAATPAQARDDYYRGHDRGGEDAAIAIGAGVVGLALGAALASGNRDRDYYYDDDYDQPRGYYYRSYPRYYGGYDNRHYRHNWRGYNGWRGDRQRGWGQRGWGQRGDRGWGRGDRHWRY